MSAPRVLAGAALATFGVTLYLTLSRTPTREQAPTAAQLHSNTPLLERNMVVNGRTQHMSNAFFWPGLASAAHLPSTAFPVGRTRAGLPVGLQVIARANNDLVGIRFCRMVSDVMGGFGAPPGWG